MYLFNQTFLVEKNTTNYWLDWIKEVYQPEVMTSGYFHATNLLKVVEGGSNDGDTFALQFELINIQKKEEARMFISQIGSRLVPQKFGENALFFITELSLLP